MSQLALLKLALASFMYVQKNVHKQFSGLMGPWDSFGLLIFSVVRVLSETVFTTNSLETKSTASLLIPRL